MTSRRSSILKPVRVREPLQDLNQLLPTNDEEETTATTSTENYKRRVSFANVNKVKEFEISAECMTLLHTPAYDEHNSLTSDSGQSSLNENSHMKSINNTKTVNSSNTSNRSVINDENIEVVEVEFFNVSRRMNTGDSSMEMTDMMPPPEMTEYETETCYPLDLTKTHLASVSLHRDSDDEILECSSMETTEALPCLITEVIPAGCELEIEVQEAEMSQDEHDFSRDVETSVSSSHRMSRRSEIFLREKPTPKRLSTEMIDPEEQDVMTTKRPSLDNDSCDEESHIFPQLQVENQNIKSIVIREQKSTLIDVDNAHNKAEITQITDINVDVAYEEISPEKANPEKEHMTENSLQENSNEIKNVDFKTSDAETINRSQEEIVLCVDAETMNRSQEEIVLCVNDIPENQSPKHDAPKVSQTFPKIDSPNKNECVIVSLANKSKEQITENIPEPTPNINNDSPENKLETKQVEISINNSLSLDNENSSSLQSPPKVTPVTPDSSMIHKSENNVGNISEIINDNSPIVIETSFDDGQNTSSMIAECDVEDMMSNLKAVNLTGDLTMCISQDENDITMRDENEPSVQIVKNPSPQIIQVIERSTEMETNADVTMSVKLESETSQCENHEENNNTSEIQIINNTTQVQQEKLNVIKNIKKILKSEMPHWCIKSITSDEWTFDALWNRLQLKISFKDNQDHCTATLHFIPKEPTIDDEILKRKAAIGDNVLKIAAGSVIRKYKPKLDLFCTNAKDVLHLLQILSPDITFAEKFAENFAYTLISQNAKLSKGIITFYVSSFEKELLIKIEVCMKILENISLSSINVTQMIGHVDVNIIYDTFCEAGRDYDFFSKFVRGVWRKINNE